MARSAVSALAFASFCAFCALAELPPATSEKDGVRCWHDVAYGARGDLADEGDGYKANGGGWTSDDLPWKRYHRHRSGQLFDVYAPTNGVKADAVVVMYLHGGSWSERYDKDAPPRELIKKVVVAGGVFCSADYILQTDRSVSPFASGRKEATFAEMLRDIDAAAKKLKKFVGELGAKSPRFVVTGESAGGHLALMYAYDQGNPDVNKLGLSHEMKVKKVVNIVGPTDFTAKEFLDLGKISILGFKISVPFFRTLMNRLMGLPDGASEKIGLKEAAKWSPVKLVCAKSVPTAIAYGVVGKDGESDGIVHVKQMTSLEAALKAANVPCAMKKFVDVGHGEVSWKGADWISGQFLSVEP